MEIELIIFDFDGTIYDLSDVNSHIYNMEVNYLSYKLKIGEMESKQLLNMNHIYPIVKSDSESATSFFERLGFDKVEWLEYKEKHFDESLIKKENSIDLKFLIEIKQKYKVALVTTNSTKVINRILLHLNIDHSMFDLIVCNDGLINGYNKKSVFQSISKQFDVPFEKMVSVGDRYKTDIIPMLELGGRGVLIHSPKDINILLNNVFSST